MTDDEPRRPGDELPEDLDVTAYVGPYVFPDIRRRRIAGALLRDHRARSACWAGSRRTRTAGFVFGGVLLLADRGVSLRGRLATARSTKPKRSRSRAAPSGFPVGHASAQLGWRGLLSRPAWRILVYSADEPPSIRGLVELDAVDSPRDRRVHRAQPRRLVAVQVAYFRISETCCDRRSRRARWDASTRSGDTPEMTACVDACEVQRTVPIASRARRRTSSQSAGSVLRYERARRTASRALKSRCVRGRRSIVADGRPLVIERHERASFAPDALAEPSAHHVVARIIKAYDSFVVRAYCLVRFRIIRGRFLEEVCQFLPREGRVVEFGCGFGLFALYFASACPELTIYGVDVDQGRIDLAIRARDRLGLTNVSFAHGDANDAEITGPIDGGYMLDLVHHLPRSSARALIRRYFDLLPPGGTLIIKDIDTRPRLQDGVHVAARLPDDAGGATGILALVRVDSRAARDGILGVSLRHGRPVAVLARAVCLSQARRVARRHPRSIRRERLGGRGHPLSWRSQSGSPPRSCSRRPCRRSGGRATTTDPSWSTPHG